MLQAEFEKKKNRMVEALVQRLLGGEDIVALQRQIDYDRGFIDGMNYPERIIAGAEAKMAEVGRESEPDDEEVDDAWA